MDNNELNVVPTEHYDAARRFTDEKHRMIVEPTIYPELGWRLVSVENDELEAMRDSEYAIDYEVMDQEGNHIMVQERVRRPSKYTGMDFTLRYKRDENPEETEQHSEFFKMKSKSQRITQPFYLLYVITNRDETQYHKYVVVDLKRLFYYYRQHQIVVDENSKNCKVEDGVLKAGVTFNRDVTRDGRGYSSSSLVNFDILYLQENFPDVIINSTNFDRRTCDLCGTEKRLKAYGDSFFWGCPNFRNNDHS